MEELNKVLVKRSFDQSTAVHDLLRKDVDF